MEPKSHHKGLKIRFYLKDKVLPWGFCLFISLVFFFLYLPVTED